MDNTLLARDTGQWTEYIPEQGDYVPIKQWGQDHWSTLAYLETRATDHGGVIGNQQMRCNPRVHREFMNRANHHSSKEYPTRLKDGELERHDDWSCLEDMCSAGLLRAWFDTFGCTFGGGKARVEFQADGHRYANAIRQHKQAGGRYGNFNATG